MIRGRVKRTNAYPYTEGDLDAESHTSKWDLREIKGSVLYDSVLYCNQQSPAGIALVFSYDLDA